MKADPRRRLSVEQVEPARTLALRRAVLRPHQSLAEIATETGRPGTFAVAALLDGVVTCCAIALPEPSPDFPDRDGSWRLRGMATAPEHRSEGLGAMVLDRIVDEVRSRGASLLWCNARLRAQAFYERAGFAVIGEGWDDPTIGPHQRMWRAT